MQIQTDRCLIRRFQEDDLDTFMVYRNNADWMQYQGFKMLSKEAYRNALLPLKEIKEGIQLAIILKESKQLIGDLYLLEEDRTLWVGYSLSPQYTKQGYALEALKSIIAWGQIKGYTYLKAGVLENNTASIKLLERAGFTFKNIEDDEIIYQLQL